MHISRRSLILAAPAIIGRAAAQPVGMALPGVGASGGAGPPLLFSDNFESYTPHIAITSPWSGGLGNTVISTTAPHAGAQCLGTGAGGNGASPTRTFASVGTWEVDVWIWITASYGGSDPPASNGPGMIMEASGSSGTTVFLCGTAGTCNWKIPFGNTLAANFVVSTGAWHHFVFNCTMGVSGSSSLVVDGGAPITFSGDTRGGANNTTVNEIIFPGQSAGASPAFEIAIDDLFVYGM